MYLIDYFGCLNELYVCLKIITHTNNNIKTVFKLKLLNYENKFTPIRCCYHSYIHFKFCSSDASEASGRNKSKVVVNYSYSSSNWKMKLINDYR
jgi:hypothetical protein